MAPAPNLYSLPLPYPFPVSPVGVFSSLMRKTASNTQPKYFFLPGVVGRYGVETVLLWPLILSHAVFLLKPSRTQSCVSFCIFCPFFYESPVVQVQGQKSFSILSHI